LAAKTKEERLEEETGKEFVREDQEDPGTRRFVGKRLEGTQTRMVCRSDANIVPSHAAGVNDQDVPIFASSCGMKAERQKMKGEK
jgi:hypothetical protein